MKEPEKVLSESDTIQFTGEVSLRTSLRTVVDAWHKVLDDLDSQGLRIAEEPHFISTHTTLMYTYEWDNANYAEELAAYNAEIAKYEEDLKAYNEWLTTGKPKEEGPSLDEKIQRAKERLANLEAAKAGQPLPFPPQGPR